MRIIAARVLSMAVAACLASCASIPLKTVYNLWNFDPWASDFRVWRAAVRLPEGRGVVLDKARVVMTVETWRAGDAVRQAETFVLERSPDFSDLAPLAAEKRDGFALAAYRFSAADHGRLESLRARIVAAKTAGGKKIHGALTISANACGGPRDAAVEGGFPFSTYLMVEVKDGYNPLLIDYDLGPELRKAADKGGDPNCAHAK